MKRHLPGIAAFLTTAASVFGQAGFGVFPPAGGNGGPSSAALQTGQPYNLTTTSASGTTYTATASPTLLVLAAEAGTFNWNVGAAACTAGAVTLNIDGLGAKSVKEADGTTDPVAADCTANRRVQLRYDGTVLRIVGGGVVGTPGAAVITRTVVTFSATPTYTCASHIQEIEITLTGNITSASLSGCVAGDILKFNKIQDGTGNRTDVWPTGFSNACAISPTANVATKQDFYWDGTNAIPMAPCTSTDTGTFIFGPTRAAPGSNPPSSNLFCWFDSTANTEECIDPSGNVTKMLGTPVSTTNGGSGANLSAAASGAIPCFTSIGVEGASVLLNTNVLPKGGGAGVCPGNSSITDNGTVVQTPENTLIGSAGTPDSALEIRKSTGGVATATPSAGTIFHVVAPNTTNGVFQMDTFGDGNFPILAPRVAGGTIAAKTALILNQNLTQVQGIGWDGSAYAVGTIIAHLASQAWTGSAHGTRFEFYTTPNGSTTPLLALTIGQDQSGIFAGPVTAPRLITPPVSLTDNGTTIATDASMGNIFRVTALTANVTLSNPTSLVDGQKITWEIIQNGAAAKTLAFGTNFGFGAEITACTISAGLSSHSFITAQYNSTTTKVYLLGCVTGY